VKNKLKKEIDEVLADVCPKLFVTAFEMFDKWLKK